mgnify:FL=1
MQKIYTAKELAKELKIHYNKVYQLVEEGKIKAVRVGRKILIPEESVQEFIRNNLS